MLHDLQLEYFVISETKLDDSFPFASFAIENYEGQEKTLRQEETEMSTGEI